MNRFLSAIVVLISSFWLAWALQEPIFRLLGLEWNSQVLGSWGDTFGAFTAFFSALGFGAVIWTLRLQQTQITRAQAQQSLEQFDRSFFHLLDLLREARSQVRFRHTAEYATERQSNREINVGIPAFRKIWLETYVRIKPVATTKEDAAKSYETNVYHRYESTLGPYFRILYTMLDRIASDDFLEEIDRIRYANLLRSQLTSDEISVAGLNGLSSVSDDLGLLLAEFRFFKYLPPGQRREILSRYYPAHAFQGRVRPHQRRSRLTAAEFGAISKV